MLHINEVELYKEPREKIQEIFQEIPGEPEMSENESAFLCGLLKKYKPRKIVEVGIAGGGTSAIILSCMKCLGMQESKLFSIDYSEKFYRNNKFFSGHLGTKTSKMLGLEKNHTVLLGGVACSFDEIKSDIDFLIIDTMHITPGEILDYITLLPYLKKEAVVVFHDIALPYAHAKHRESYVMGLLFACSAGEKYVNTFDFGDKYSNIGAIKITGETIKDIEKVFLSLLVPWEYIPDNKQLDGYRQVIAEHYKPLLVELFDKAVEMNMEHPKVVIRTKWLFPFDMVEKRSRIALFCVGGVGQEFIKQISNTNYCNVVAVADNDVEKQVNGVLPPTSLKKLEFDYVVISVINKKVAIKIISELVNLGITREKIIWRDYRVDK